MAKNKRIRAQQRQRGLIRTVLIFAFFLVVCTVLITVLLKGSEDGDIRDYQSAVNSPIILPDSTKGKKNSTWITLYFRHGESKYIAPKHRRVDVSASETVEAAAVRQLIEGTGASGSLTDLLPENTELLKTDAEGDIFYVTFNDKILWRPVNNPSDSAIDLRLRLSAQSIVNTIIDVGRYSKVQILVDGKIPKRSDLGFDVASPDGEKPLEAMGYDYDIVLNAEKTLDICLNSAKNRDWKTLYSYVSSGANSQQRYDYETMRKNWEERDYQVVNWEIVGQISGAEQSKEIFHLDLYYSFDDGKQAIRKCIPVCMSHENDAWKLPYDNLTRIIEIPENS